MEVHHHSKVHQEKKWKEYLFEFLMLFLAVSSGFVVENLREQYVENERAHVIAKAFSNDLTADTTMLSDLIMYRRNKMIILVTLAKDLEKPARSQNDSLIAQLSLDALTSRKYFESESGTYEQIKNSGALRYYPLSVQQSMIKYEQSISKLKITDDVENKFVMEQIMPALLSGVSFRFIAAVNHRKEYREIKPLRKNDPVFKDDLYNYAVYMGSRSSSIITHMEEVKSNAIILINKLHEEYIK